MPASRVSVAAAREIARRWYGIDGDARRLASEHDDTFRLVTAEGSVLLKVSGHGGHDVSFQTALLQHLEATAPALPVQRVVPALDGRPEVSLDGGALARVTSWLDGTLLGQAAAGVGLRREIGATLARLNLALRGFSHPGARRTHDWDLQRFGCLRPLLARVPASGPLRAALGECLDRFDAVVAPRLADPGRARLRRQVIHSDFHGENLLTDGRRVTGILDFGDALAGPVAMDVGVAACYQLGDGRRAGRRPDDGRPQDHPGDGQPADEDPLAPALDVVTGYHATDPLSRDELGLVAEFIVCRVAARIIVSQRNAAREPANSAYLLRRTPQAIEHLQALRRCPPGAIAKRLLAACDVAG